MDHDRLFKQLISNFFVEFIELFLPAVAAYLDQEFAMVPLDKEIFTDVTSGDSHEVDLLMRAKYLNKDAFFLFHTEHQSQPQLRFPQRMFFYYSRLLMVYNQPVYPIVIYSHDKPLRQEPDHFEVSFPDKTVLRFDYTVIQLNRMSWRQFVNTPNPVASALMSKMNVSKEDRPKVKLECLRLLASLKLDPAKSKLIGVFVESYLKLTKAEMAVFEQEKEKLAPIEKEATMELMTSWERKGRTEGIAQGKEEMALRIIGKRFGTVPASVPARLDRLSAASLDDLAEALLDISTTADLDQWLTNHSA
jgi:hypothetical protein